MADERGAALLRAGVTSPRATFLELFFDLVFVFALTRVSQRIIDDLATARRELLVEIAQTLLIFLAFWAVWTLTAWVTSRYEPERAEIQLVVVCSMLGCMVMAVATPRAFAERALAFALGYVAVQVGRPLFLTVALRGHPRRQITVRIAAWATVSAVPWVLGALLPGRWRLACWTVAVAIDYVGLMFGWPTPRLGTTRASTWEVLGEHLAERYQQFFLIALGENILVIGLSFSGHSFSRASSGAFLLSFVTTGLLWRIYFHRAGHLFAEAIRVSRSPGKLGESASWTHLVIVGGVLMTAVGYELAIAHPHQRAGLAWAFFLMGGPAIFLTARARFEYEIFGRVSRSRVVGVLVLVALMPVAARVSTVIALASATAVLVAITVADFARSYGRPVERPAPG
ncbi:low temperature requirement protein A [Micromonospora matsumotoense]|uniref:low temperature requirement protein A n=1 Tax=Micromonospora matsumotoense TaxID=121616 RepID=UPI0034038CB8